MTKQSKSSLPASTSALQSKSTPKNNAQTAASKVNHSENSGGEFYRLLIKIEIQGATAHNIMLPTPITTSIEDLLKNVAQSFKNEIKCCSIYLESQTESLYAIDKSFKVGQCFRDCDKVVIKAETNSKKQVNTKNKETPKPEAPKVQPLIAKRAQPEKKPQANESNKKQKVQAPTTSPAKVNNGEEKLGKNAKRKLQKAEAEKKDSPKKQEVKAPKQEKKVVEKKLPNDDVKQVQTEEKPQTLSKNQKRRLKKQQEKSSSKEDQITKKEEAKVQVQVQKPQAKPKVSKKAESEKQGKLDLKKQESFTFTIPQSPVKVNEGEENLGKNAKRKLKKAEAEKQIAQKESELKILRSAIQQGINGYSQEEASKSTSEDHDSLNNIKLSSEDPKSQIDSFLSKMNQIGKTKAQKASTGTKEDLSDSSSFGSIQRISS